MSKYLVRVIDVSNHSGDTFVILDVREVDPGEAYDQVTIFPYRAKRPPVVRRDGQGKPQQLEVLMSGMVPLHAGGTLWLYFNEPPA